jgi:hypothetical protein
MEFLFHTGYSCMHMRNQFMSNVVLISKRLILDMFIFKTHIPIISYFLNITIRDEHPLTLARKSPGCNNHNVVTHGEN